MPDFLFSSAIDPKKIEQRIDNALALLSQIDNAQKSYFLKLLQARQSEFHTALADETLSHYENAQVLEQYNRFSQTLSYCLSHPERSHHSIANYHRIKYHPVGIYDVEKPNPLTHRLAIAAVSTGLGILLACIPMFVFSPVIAATMIALSITLLLPSGFSLLVPDSPNITRKKNEEKQLFEQGAKLLSAEPIVDAQQSDPKQISALR